MHVVVSRSAFRSQNCQTLPGSEHFSKLRCSKSVRRCGVKHILMSKCTPRSGQLWTLRCRKSACRCGAKHISKSNVKNTPQTRHTTLHYSYSNNNKPANKQTNKQTNNQPSKQASKQPSKQASKHTNIKTNKHTLDKIGSFRSF